MKKLVSFAIVVMVMAASGYAAATLTAGSAAESALAQQYSPKCQTPSQVCYVDAQPVGSPCQCNGEPGTVVP